MKIDGININGITSDSRKVKKGYAFVAIKGEEKDGNDYIDSAIKNGAVIIYSEKEILGKPIPIVKVENARITLANMLNMFYGYPSQKISLIGVTGTNGKTTTTHIIEDIFRNAGFKTGLIGTLGIKINGVCVLSSLTTPEPEVLFDMLNRMAQQGVQVVIMEVSSHGLKFHRTYGLDFDIAIHTNIEIDHMNIHKDINDYINTKKMLFDSLKRNRISILNIDDNNAMKLIMDNDKTLILTYGLNSKASITASSLELNKEVCFTVCLQRGLTALNGTEVEPLEFPVKLNLMGKHNVYNSLAAIGVALYFGISPNTISNSLSNFHGVYRRLNKIYDKDFLVIDDFSHNPSGYEAVFETIQGLDYNKIILVNAIRGNRGIEINEYNANVICSWSKIIGPIKIILSKSEDAVEENDRVKDEEISVYQKVFDKNSISYSICNTLEEAINEALNNVIKRDIVLLLGAQGMNKGRHIFLRLTSLK
ncbi:Mur ligase family protein [Brassicibacter mesophilus]|uniref:Mur ligase family protein n=1 Tax=Brassicibacter mesophilus TaxID=745119 RepID=UPI003D226FFC